MPKAKWGAGDKALTAGDIDGAERSESRVRYSGPTIIPSGTYRWVIQYMKQTESAAKNPMIEVMLTLDSTWKKNHAEFEGFPMWDRITVIESTKEKLANFLDSIGATGSDLLDKCILDEGNRITKLGNVGDPSGLLVYCTIEREKPTKEYPNARMRPGFNAYIPVNEDDEAEAAGGAADDGGEPPF
jgi:hypothetical protein